MESMASKRDWKLAPRNTLLSMYSLGFFSKCCIHWSESRSSFLVCHHWPGCSVTTSLRPGWRWKTPEKIMRWIGRRVSSLASYTQHASPPGRLSGSPAPPCVARVRPRSSHADQNGSHTGSLYLYWPPQRDFEIWSGPDSDGKLMP